MPRKLLCALLIAASVPLIAAHHKGSEDPVFQQIDAIVKSLSEITGLSEKQAIPYGTMSKRQLRQFLNKRIKKTLRPEEIHADELALKMFGLVPQEFDLKKSTVDLLTEQAAAFYDYDDKKLFVLADSSQAAEVTTLAHELSHALADQYFNLTKFMDESPPNDDENLAHTAVVEGQASWLMIAYDLKHGGQPPLPTPQMLKSVVDSSQGSLMDYPVLKASPLYIQQSLLFPYTDGMMFFDAVYKKEGKQAFTAVFKDPPMDSAQIIHPERYFSHEKALEPALPKLAYGGREDEISGGSLGEFDHQVLLQEYLNAATAKALAPHLRGASFKIVKTGKHHRPALLYVSEWESADCAAEFFGSYRKILNAKWKHCDFSTTKANLLAGEGDNGYFLAKLEGDTVSSIEGLEDQSEWEVLSAVSSSLR